MNAETMGVSERNALIKKHGLWGRYLQSREAMRQEGGGRTSLYSQAAFEKLLPVIEKREKAEAEQVGKLASMADLDGPEFQEYLDGLPEGEDRLGAVEFAVRTRRKPHLRKFPSQLAFALWTLMRELPADKVADLFAKTLPSKSVIEKTEARRDDGSATLDTIRRLQRIAKDTSLSNGAERPGEEPGVAREGGQPREPVEAGR